MVKKLKKILAITSCLLMLCSSMIFADTETNSNAVYSEDVKKPIYSFSMSGYTFTYENAPQEIKDRYDQKCMELGITANPNAEIFIPVDEIQSYNLTKSRISVRASDIYISYYGNYYTASGAKNYTVFTSTLVGYGHTVSGNPVHLAQVLLKRAGYSTDIDSLFGSDTYNKVKSFQSRYGLSADGIVGFNTWDKFSSWSN